METPCLFCLEQIKENVMINPIGCHCNVKAHKYCFEQWFAQKHQMECPICHTVSVPNRIAMDTVHVIYVQTPEERPRFNPIARHDKAAAFCCCLLLGWAFGITIINMVTGH